MLGTLKKNGKMWEFFPSGIWVDPPPLVFFKISTFSRFFLGASLSLLLSAQRMCERKIYWLTRERLTYWALAHSLLASGSGLVERTPKKVGPRPAFKVKKPHFSRQAGNLSNL